MHFINKSLKFSQCGFRFSFRWSCQPIKLPHIITLQSKMCTNVTKVVTKEQARQMVTKYNQMPNDIILMMAVAGDQEAKQERLIREIMKVDDIEWNPAYLKFIEIMKANRELMFFASIPYHVGLYSALFGSALSVPLIFHYSTVKHFNEIFVTADHPEEKDVETFLEVGSWAWGWMEPVLGEISFVLLCLQFARSQLQNLGWKPYSAFIASYRANRLHKRYPQYSKLIISDFAKGDGLSGTVHDAQM